MSHSNSEQLVDIFDWPTSLSHAEVDHSGSVLIGAILLMVFIALIARYRLAALRRLKQDLKRGRIDTREAAHRLSRLMELTAEQRRQLNAMRFSQRQPDANQLLDFIQKLKP